MLLDWPPFAACEGKRSSEPSPEPAAPTPERDTSSPVSSGRPPTPGPSATPTPQTVTERIATERVIERVEPRYITVTGVDEATLARTLAELENKLRSVITLSGSGGSSGGGTTIIRETADLDAIWRAISLTNKIDELGNVTLRDVTFEGTVTGLPSADTSGLLPLAGGALTGDLTIDSNVFVVDTAHDRVGVGTSTPTDTFSLNGPAYLAQISAPSVTTDRLYNTGGDLYWAGSVIAGGSVGTWATDGTHAWRAGGNVGIGTTTSPSARLHVFASTTATGARIFELTDSASTTRFSVDDSGLASTTSLRIDSVGGSGTKCLQTDANGLVSAAAAACGSGGGGGGDSKWATSTIDTLGIHLNSALRVGIGTTTPKWALQIASSTGAQLTLSDPSSLSNNHWSFRNAGGNLYLATSSASTFATSTNSAFAIEENSTGATTTFKTGLVVDGGRLTHFEGAATEISNLNLGNMRFDDDAGMVVWIDLPVTSSAAANTVQSYSAQIDDIDVLTVWGLANGEGGLLDTRVGIGTTSPYAKFSVVGEIVGAYFTGTTTATSTLGGPISAASGDLIVSAFGTTNDLLLNPYGGSVGIGTTSPVSNLAIAQSADTLAGGLYVAATDGDHRAIYMNTSQVLNFEGGSGNTATLDAAGVWTDASDIAYKENLSELSYGFKELMELKPRAYTMKGSGSPQIGFIAQELEKVIPEVVTGEDGKKGIAYGHIVPVVVKAMQEQSEALFGKEKSDENRTLFERFAARVKEAIASLARLFVPELATNRLCVGATCVTETELKELLNDMTVGSSIASSHEAGAEDTSPEDLEPPVIEIRGANPAAIEVGARYSDNGARVTDNANDNLGYTIMLDGEETGQVELNTSNPGMHKITYTATDQAGNTASATRIVEIVDPAAEDDQDEPVPQDTASASTTPRQSATTTPAGPEEEGESIDAPEGTPDTAEQNTDPASTTPESPGEQTAITSPTT